MVMNEQDYYVIPGPLRLNFNSIGGAFTFHLSHHQVNILFDQQGPPGKKESEVERRGGRPMLPRVPTGLNE